MLNKFSKTFILATVVATLSTGCRYSKEYQKLTEAGNKYTSAVDKLLIKASELQIDASSEKLLLNDRSSNQTLKNYQDSNRMDREMLATISDIREHNQLLQDYFTKLKELAHSDAPEQTKIEIDGITSNLQKIGSKLQANSSSPRLSLFGNIGKLIVHSKIDGVLKEELEKRNPTILKELTIQQEILKSLGESMKYRIELIQQAREQRLVIRPLIEEQPIADELVPQWIQERKQIFLIDKHVREIEQASYALEDFKDIYKASVEGKINSERLNNSLRDIDSFLALLENNQ
ncbi:hypothetical protein [Chlorogloeopsis sp. ULAP02]|uniref:hypothetical protein n=1 Tax=Chlorogloeopsis sp. ULAP02 TaxID=3107926 RepID=UPI003134F371